MTRVWPIPVAMIAGVAGFLALIFWLSAEASRTPQQTTVTITQGDTQLTQTKTDTSDWAAARRECDKQVATLLTTQDRLDFDRAAFLVKYLDCGVSSRLPR
jgi:hypothetical protein